MAGIGIVVNPRAGAIIKDPGLPDRLKVLLGDHGELLVAAGKDEIGGAIETLRDRRVDVIGIVGGDGSNLYTLTAATQVFNGDLPPMALLPGGSVNTVGRSLGVRGRPEKLLQRLIHAHTNGGFSIEPVQTMRVNGLVGFIFGAGLVGRFYEHFYRGKGKGPWDATLMVGRALGAAVFGGRLARQVFAPVPGKLRLDGEEVALDSFTLLLASTIDNHFGFKVTYRGREQPDRFHLVASNRGRGRLAAGFPKALVGKPLGKGEGFLDAVAGVAELEFDEPAKYIIDGDLYEGRHVTIEAGPRLDLVAP